MPPKKSSIQVPSYILEQAQKSYQRLQSAIEKIKNNSPEKPSQNIVLEFDPSLLQDSIKAALCQLENGETPVLKLNMQLEVIPEKLVSCVEECFQESALLSIGGNKFLLGSWRRKNVVQPSEKKASDIQDSVKDMISKFKEQDNQSSS